jgi:hypothetical protein
MTVSETTPIVVAKASALGPAALSERSRELARVKARSKASSGALPLDSRQHAGSGVGPYPAGTR